MTSDPSSPSSQRDPSSQPGSPAQPSPADPSAPGAAGADAAAARYGNGYSVGHSLGRHAYVRVGESDHAGWGREYYYEAEDDPSVRFKIVSAFYWVPAIENPQQPRLLFGADYDLDYWEPS